MTKRASQKEVRRAEELYYVLKEVMDAINSALHEFEELDDSFEVDDILNLIEESGELTSKMLEDIESFLAYDNYLSDQELARESFRW